MIHYEPSQACLPVRRRQGEGATMTLGNPSWTKFAPAGDTVTVALVGAA